MTVSVYSNCTYGEVNINCIHGLSGIIANYDKARDLIYHLFQYASALRGHGDTLSPLVIVANLVSVSQQFSIYSHFSGVFLFK